MLSNSNNMNNEWLKFLLLLYYFIITIRKLISITYNLCQCHDHH